jgi:hypothetical protein
VPPAAAIAASRTPSLMKPKTEFVKMPARVADRYVLYLRNSALASSK